MLNLRWVVGCCFLLMCSWTYAEVGITIPASTNPAVISQTQQCSFQLPSLSAKPIITKTANGAVISDANKLKFNLQQINLSGNTAIKTQQLTPLYKAYLGKIISLTQLQTIVDSITAYYRQQGYVLSRAILPAQKITQGIVTIQIVESYIEKISIDGTVTPKLSRLLQQFGARIKDQRPLQGVTLERFALLANDLPGIVVQTVITPNKNKLGAADLIFVVTEKKYAVDIAYDNRNTRWLGPHEMTVAGQVNNLLRAGDLTRVDTLNSFDMKRLIYLTLTHETPLGSNGTRLSITGNYTHSHPGFTLQPFDIVGDSYSIATNISYPLIRAREENLYVRVGFNSLNSKNDILTTGLNKDRTCSVNVGLDYNRFDPWDGINTVSGRVSQGLDILGARMNGTDLLPLSRPNGHAAFTKFEATVSRMQFLPAQFSILVSGTGQYALNPLLSSEQFTFGGSQYGTAYDSAELIGDSGAAGRLELRHDFVIPNAMVLKSIQLFTHYDAGIVWNRDLNSGQLPRATATSVGAGLRANLMQYLSTELEVAKPLTYRVNEQLLNGEYGKLPRIFFSVKAHL